MKRLFAIALICTATSAMAVELPPEIAKQGSLRVAIVPNYPPLEFKDPATNTLTGFDVELGEVLGRKLGIKIAWQETSFDQMMPAITSGRVDAILSGMTDLASRQDSATFVDYLRNGPRFFVQQSRASEFKDTTAFCGKRVGASRRTSFPKLIAAWSDTHCGGNPVNFVGTEGSADARTQLKQGRIDAAVQGGETLPYMMDLEPGAYVPIGDVFAVQFTGLALGVKEKVLQQAVVEALDALIADGSYRALLTKWKLTDYGVEKATINAGQ
ncbi:ABC transporter substrate-binding protein [Bradyrhizobium lablabi]|uniref:ABC transporter substrate-binding protein n=1 Tax=Bradyrhizobium lablabi TaxID=722472 RepID=A0A0R3MPQ8_9BRAD|nr:ABC transporter substrate-binding protein [Bradyrhizobium lablabi]KRR21566.1 ABC transporter substrate-binding protein [Bradyrhizobium lablabi]